MVSGKEHTQSKSAGEGRAGRVTCKQSANGEIKEDIPYIYPLGREHTKERLLRWKQSSEALNCWRGRDNAVQPQRTGHTLLHQVNSSEVTQGLRTTQGHKWMQKLLLWKWHCSWKLGAVWTCPCKKLWSNSWMKNWISSWIAWQYSSTATMCCTQLRHFRGNFLLWSLHPEVEAPWEGWALDIKQDTRAGSHGTSWKQGTTYEQPKWCQTEIIIYSNVNQKANLVIQKLYCKKNRAVAAIPENFKVQGENKLS